MRCIKMINFQDKKNILEMVEPKACTSVKFYDFDGDDEFVSKVVTYVRTLNDIDYYQVNLYSFINDEVTINYTKHLNVYFSKKTCNAVVTDKNNMLEAVYVDGEKYNYVNEYEMQLYSHEIFDDAYDFLHDEFVDVNILKIARKHVPFSDYMQNYKSYFFTDAYTEFSETYQVSGEAMQFVNLEEYTDWLVDFDSDWIKLEDGRLLYLGN